MVTWKKLVKPLALDRPMSVADPPTSGHCWSLQSWARYIQSRPPVVDTIDWKRPLTFLLRGEADPCTGGSWTQLSIGLLNHGARGRPPDYIWVIGMAVSGDKDMAALAIKWAQNSLVYGLFFCVGFCVSFSRLIFNIWQILITSEKFI